MRERLERIRRSAAKWRPMLVGIGLAGLLDDIIGLLDDLVKATEEK